MRHVRAAGLVALLVLGGPTALAHSDGDSDKVEDDLDNCQGSANPFQFDIDDDGEGDICERPIPMSDAFEGTPGSDLVFGSYRDSVLAGSGGGDALYGGPGNDVLNGGPGPDTLVGGPGDDLITGGPACDVFGIDLAIEHRDVISDFQPAVDRVRFPPLSRDAASNRLPSIELGGAEWLEVTFLIEHSPDAVVVFEGLKPGTRLVLSTDPCSKPPPPAAFCRAPGARRSMVFVGFEDLFCPEGGKLSIDAVASESATFSAEKILGDRLTSK